MHSMKPCAENISVEWNCPLPAIRGMPSSGPAPSKTRCAQLYTAPLFSNAAASKAASRNAAPGARETGAFAVQQAVHARRAAKTAALLPAEPVAQSQENAGPRQVFCCAFSLRFSVKNTARRSNVFTTRTHHMLQSRRQSQLRRKLSGRLQVHFFRSSSTTTTKNKLCTKPHSRPQHRTHIRTLFPPSSEQCPPRDLFETGWATPACRGLGMALRPAQSPSIRRSAHSQPGA